MYPFYFFICLLFSVGMLVSLVLLAIFPVNLPIVSQTKQTSTIVHHRKARSPTHRAPSIGYWDTPWEDDDDDL